MVRFKMLVLLVLIVMTALVAQQKGAAPYEKGVIVDANGDMLQWHKWAGYPPKDYVPAGEINKDAPKALVMVPDIVPAYDWAYGCTATATAMISAFYDNYGADNVYIGPENSGVAPMTSTPWIGQSSQSDTVMNPLAASKMGVDGRATRGHGDDYWTGYLDEATDPYYGAWTEHDHNSGQRCTADFMGTNQWYNWANADGSTAIFNYLAPEGRKLYDKPDQDNGDGTFSRDGNHGWRLFFESLGMTVKENYNQLVDGYDDPDDDPDEGPVVDGYTFADYKSSIDAGIPVLIHVIGHSIVGYGYDESYSPPRVYVRSTWNTDTSHNEYFSWGGLFSNMQHYSMSPLILASKEYYSSPQNVLALNNNRIVTVSWDDPSEGTRNLTYTLFRDGLQLATGLTGTSYIDSSVSDGLHHYSLRAVYTDPNPDVTSYMSEEVAVYVSPSVTDFYDDFEDGVSDWLMNPTWGNTHAWGQDSQYKYQGSYSLSDSPGNTNYGDLAGYYGNQTEDLAAGGSIAEVIPGLDFSTATDATCSFYLTYAIEESFDYLHFQATEDGVAWETLKTWSWEANPGGDWGGTYTPSWSQEVISLGLYAGKPNVRFRFILVTDPYYTSAGANIDNFDITPSTVDTSSPYVYYNKVRDYYTSWPEGHWLETNIVDFTGIDYARILYKVNGGSEITLNPSVVDGSRYEFQFPDLTDGDMVEFRFDVQDTANPANQGYKGPFYYVHGLHQKYDYGTVSYYTEIGPDGTSGDISYAVKFSSYHDDVVGAVVRGYTSYNMENGLEEELPNSDMQINVWADNGGLPGATLITPFNFDNPATVSETNAFGYVDLSAYTQLQNMVGDYFIGFKASDGTLTRSTTTECSPAGEFDFGRAYSQAAADNQWYADTGYNYHLRCITTNNVATPPTIVPEAGTVNESLAIGATTTKPFSVGNGSNFDALTFNASFYYDSAPAGVKEKATITIHSNDFATGLGSYVSSGGIAWTGTGGQAVLNANGGGQPSANTTGTLTSNSFDGTQCTSLNLSFDQNFSTGGNSSVSVEYYDGSAWTPIYNASSSTTASQNIALPNISANMQVRFNGSMRNRSGDSWSVDNVVVSGPEVLTLTWLTLDGGTTTGGTIAAEGSQNMTLGFDATGLTVEGEYVAVMQLTSPDADPEDVTIKLLVGGSGPVTPAIPANLVTSVNSGNLVIDWDVSADATGYDVYASNDPYAGFALVESVGTNQYSIAITDAKKFYYIVATNATKAVPKKNIKTTIKTEKSGN